jgi:hypothetical protein
MPRCLVMLYVASLLSQFHRAGAIRTTQPDDVTWGPIGNAVTDGARRVRMSRMIRTTDARPLRLVFSCGSGTCCSVAILTSHAFPDGKLPRE